MSAADIGFTRYKSRQVIAWTLANLRRVGDAPSISAMGQPFAGRTVFVVGAGPSLAKNVEALRGRGPVVCVNAATRPLALAGITPDVVVVRESLDVTDQIAECDATLVACDVSVHPATWTAAGERIAWFVPGYPRHAEIALALGEVPLFGGPAALCSAVALSLRWGAARVVLVGCDLAFAPGAAYHPDAPRGTLRFEVDGAGDDRRITFSGDEQDDDRCVRSGQQPPPKSVAYSEVIAWDWGGVLPTINTLVDQRVWLATQADRHGARVELINATEGGTGVPGWRVARLADVSGEAESVRFESGPTLTDAQVQAALDVVRVGASRLEQAAREMQSSRGPDLRALASIDGLVFGSPLAEALGASRLLDVAEQTPVAKTRAIYAVLAAAAEEAQHMIMGRAL